MSLETRNGCVCNAEHSEPHRVWETGDKLSTGDTETTPGPGGRPKGTLLINNRGRNTHRLNPTLSELHRPRPFPIVSDGSHANYKSTKTRRDSKLTNRALATTTMPTASMTNADHRRQPSNAVSSSAQHSKTHSTTAMRRHRDC